MGRRRSAYTGTYVHHPPPAPRQTIARTDFIQTMNNYFWSVYSSIHGNYLAVATVFLVVLLSFILPDISQKIQRTQELKAMKKAFDLVTEEVSRAEVACLTVAEQIGFLQNSMHDGATETEVTLMSYVYTDSFNATKKSDEITAALN